MMPSCIQLKIQVSVFGFYKYNRYILMERKHANHVMLALYRFSLKLHAH